MFDIQRGDVFCSSNPQGLGSIISLVQAFWRPDSEGEFGHSGIILSGSGRSIESLWKVKERNIFESYTGEKILIGRPIPASTEQEKQKQNPQGRN